MKRMGSWSRAVAAGVCLLAGAALAAETPKNLARNAKTKASSTHQQYKPEFAVDGNIEDDNSRWVAVKADGGHWLELTLPAKAAIGSAHVYSGWGEKTPVRGFVLQYWDGSAFVAIPGAAVRDNDKPALAVTFAKPVETDRIRLTSDDNDLVRVKELMLWAPMPEGSPKLLTGAAAASAMVDPSKHYVFANQCGYNAGWPKRFTAPQSPDGTKFTVTAANDAKALFEGVIKGGIGDFTGFEPPAGSAGEYVIRVSGGELAEAVSHPFAIQPRLLQNIALEINARFMQDARSVVGTHPSAYGGGAFRDSTYYTFEMPSLVLLYLSDPAWFDKLPVEIDANAEKARILDPKFALVKAPNDQDALATARRYYNELEQPVGERVPDIIRVIHWGVGFYLLDPQQHDPSKDPLGNKIHSQTIEQFAFFLYGYPAYKQYIPEAFFKRVADFTFEQWEKVGLFNVDTTVGDFKGRHCPGHSIMPSLMMHEVAKRLGRDDAGRYLDAAVAQAKWVVEKLDPADPLVTKGQRMSEHKLVPALAMLLRDYPQAAPAGTKPWLSKWADAIIARSANLWDFRKYAENQWTLPKRPPGFDAGVGGGAGWNEPGNLAACAASTVAAAAVLDDPAKAKRLFEIGVAQIDNLFGRNPVGAHTSHNVKNYAGTDRGWPSKFPDNVCARLELVRGTINSSASDEHYPFNPGAAFRHPEGWTAFNAAFNVGLAYLNWYENARTQTPAGFGLFRVDGKGR